MAYKLTPEQYREAAKRRVSNQNTAENTNSAVSAYARAIDPSRGIDNKAQQTAEDTAAVSQEKNSGTDNWILQLGATVLGDVVIRPLEGTAKFVENSLLDFTAGIVATGLDWVGADDAAESVQDFAAIDFVGDAFDWEPIQAIYDSSFSNEWGKFGDILQQATYSVGQQAVPLALTALNGVAPGLGTVLSKVAFAQGAYGASFEAASQDGGSVTGASLYGAISAGLETAIEAIGGPLSWGSKGVSSGLKQTIKNVAKSKTAQKAVEIVFGAVEEGTEEVISGALENYVKAMTYKADTASVEAYFRNIAEADPATAEELLEQFFVGAMSGAMMGGGMEMAKANSPTMQFSETSQELQELHDKAYRLNEKGKDTSAVEAEIAEKDAELAGIANKYKYRLQDGYQKGKKGYGSIIAYMDNYYEKDSDGNYGASKGALIHHQNVGYGARQADVDAALSGRAVIHQGALTGKSAEARTAVDKAVKNINKSLKGQRLSVVYADVNQKLGKTNYGYIDQANRVIVLDARYLGTQVDFKASDGNVYKVEAGMSTLLHEVFHDVENTKAGDKLKKTLAEYARANEERTDVVQEVKEAYQKESAETLQSELAARQLENLLLNERVINALTQDNSTLAKRILRGAERLLAALKGENLAETKDLERILNKTIRLYNKAIAQKGKGQTVKVKSKEKKENEEVKYSKKESFAKQIDDVLSGKDTSNTHLRVMDTPQLLQEAGLPNLPILMTAKHLKTITSKSGNVKGNYHGLDVEIVKKLPEYISDPVIIADSLTRGDSVVIVTEAVDSENRPVIAAILLEGQGAIDNEYINANIMTSAYGKDNFQSFLDRMAAENAVIYWNKKKSQDLSVNLGVQFPNIVTSLSSNVIIRKTKAKVNTFEKNSSENISNKEENAKAIDKNGEIMYSKKTAYNQYKTEAMIWSNANTTKIGDVKILYDNKSQTFKLIESTKTGEGFIEVKSGNYEELEELYNARVAETENYVLDENIEGYENVQRGNSWDLLNSNKRSGNGRVGGIYQSEQGGDAATDNERGRKNSQAESLIDIDDDGDDWVDAIVRKVYGYDDIRYSRRVTHTSSEIKAATEDMVEMLTVAGNINEDLFDVSTRKNYDLKRITADINNLAAQGKLTEDSKPVKQLVEAIIDSTVLTEHYAGDLREQAVLLDTLRPFLHSMNFQEEGIKAELQHKYGKENNVFRLWGKKSDGAAWDSVVQEITEIMPMLKKDSDLETLFNIIDSYTQAVKDMKRVRYEARSFLSKANNEIETEVLDNGLKAAFQQMGKYNSSETESITRNANYVIAENYEDISTFVEKAEKGINGQEVLFLGKISDSVAELVEEKTQISIKGKSIALSSDDIRHIFKNHGNAKNEENRGQVAITKGNIENIIETILSPDNVTSETEKADRISIIFEKQLNGHNIAITVLSNKKNTLTLKSARIMKNRISSSNDAQAPSSTSKTLGGMNESSTTIIHKNSEKSTQNAKKVDDGLDEIKRLMAKQLIVSLSEQGTELVTKVTADKLSETLKTERKEMQKALRAIKNGDKTVSIGDLELPQSARNQLEELSQSIAKERAENEKHSHRVITVGMTEQARYEALRNRSLSNIPAAQALSKNVLDKIGEISSWEDINKYFGGDKKRIVRKIAKEFGVFKGYSNRDINLKFEFSGRNFEESYSKQKKEFVSFAKMLSVFDQVVESAIGIEAHNRNTQGYKVDGTLKNVYVLASAFIDGDNIVPIKLEVKEFSDKKNTLYVAIALESIKKERVLTDTRSPKALPDNIHPSSSNISISQLFRKVNPSDKDFYKYIPKMFFETDRFYAEQQTKGFIRSIDNTLTPELVNEIARTEEGRALTEFVYTAYGEGDTVSYKAIQENALAETTALKRVMSVIRDIHSTEKQSKVLVDELRRPEAQALKRQLLAYGDNTFADRYDKLQNSVLALFKQNTNGSEYLMSRNEMLFSGALKELAEAFDEYYDNKNPALEYAVYTESYEHTKGVIGNFKELIDSLKNKKYTELSPFEKYTFEEHLLQLFGSIKLATTAEKTIRNNGKDVSARAYIDSAKTVYKLFLKRDQSGDIKMPVRTGVKEVGVNAVVSWARPNTVIELAEHCQYGEERNGGLTGQYQEIHNGLITFINLRNEYVTRASELLKKRKGYRQRLQAKVEVRHSKGVVKMTRAEALSLYKTIVQADCAAHINASDNLAGGVNFHQSNGKGYRFARGLKFTEENISNLYNSFSEADKAYMTAVEQILEDLGRLKAEVDTYVYGNPRLKQGYYPMHVAGYEQDRDIGDKKRFYNPFDPVDHLSITQRRERSRKALIVKDICAELESYISSVSMYYGLAIPLNDFNLVYNARGADGESYKSLLQQYGFFDFDKYIDNLLLDIQGVKKDEGLLKKVLGWIRSNHALSVLAYNMKTPIVQIGSMVMIASEMKNSSAIYGVAHAGDVFKRQNREKMFQYCPDTKARFNGNQAYKAEGNLDLAMNTAVHKVAEFGMKGIETVDEMTVYAAWAGFCKEEGAIGKHANDTIRLQRAGKKLARLLDNLDRFDATSRNAISRSSNPLVNWAAQWHSSQIGMADALLRRGAQYVQRRYEQQYLPKLKKEKESEIQALIKQESELKKALQKAQSEKAEGEVKALEQDLKLLRASEYEVKQALEYLEGKESTIESEVKQAGHRLKKTICAVTVSIVASSVLATLIKGVIDGIGSDDEEEKQNLLYDFLSDFFGNTLSLLPFVGQIYNAMDFKIGEYEKKGYDVSIWFFDVINDLMDAFNGMNDVANGTKEAKVAVRDTLYSVGKLFGVPMTNFYKIVNLATSVISPELNYQFRHLFNSSNYASDLQKAVEAGDSELAETIVGLMLKDDGGAPDTKVVTTIRSLYEQGYTGVIPRTVSSSVAIDGETYDMTTKQQKRFKQLYSQADEKIERLIGKQSFVNLSPKVQADSIKWIYDYYYQLAKYDLAGIEDDSKKALFGAHIDVETLAVAYSYCNSLEADTDKKGNSIAGSRKQKVVKYLNSLKLSAAEKYMILGYLGYSPVNQNAKTLITSYARRNGADNNEIKEILAACNIAA